MAQDDRLRPLVNETTPWFAFEDKCGDWWVCNAQLQCKLLVTLESARLLNRDAAAKLQEKALEKRDALNRIYGVTR